jgi:hypothetical protein
MGQNHAKPQVECLIFYRENHGNQWDLGVPDGVPYGTRQSQLVRNLWRCWPSIAFSTASYRFLVQRLVRPLPCWSRTPIRSAWWPRWSNDVTGGSWCLTFFNYVSVSLRPYQWSALVTSQEPVLQISCSCRNIRCVRFVHPLKRRSKKLTSRAPAGLTYSYDTTSARDNQDASYWKMAEVGALSFRGTTLFRT